MAVSVEMQHTGDPNMQAEVRAVVEHELADRPGDWRVLNPQVRRLTFRARGHILGADSAIGRMKLSPRFSSEGASNRRLPQKLS